MKIIILKFYKISEETKQRFNLSCDIRFIAYDYRNKIILDGGVSENLSKNEFLKINKIRFRRIKKDE